MKFCPNCKSLANDTEETCEVCGNKLELITTTLKLNNKIEDKNNNKTKVINNKELSINKDNTKNTSKIGKSNKVFKNIKFARIFIVIFIILVLITIILLFFFNKNKNNMVDINKVVVEIKDNKINNIQYTEYENNRFGFVVSIPKIFDNIYEAENGDGITCFNNNDSSRLMVYSYNNISKESTMEGYYDIIGSIDSNVTIVTSNLEDHYFSLIYDDEKFEYFNYKQYYNNVVNAITYIYPKKDKEYYSYITKYICDSFKIICVKENY